MVAGHVEAVRHKNPRAYSRQVEAIEVHHLGPGLDEILDELRLRIRASVDLRQGPPPMAAERKRLLTAQAQHAEMDNAERAGELLPRRDVELAWSRLVVEARTALLALPSRFKQRLPHLSAADLSVIDSLIRQILEEMADNAGRVVTRARRKPKET
jgi:phage terminase Nu1 subunit (DNA packaging protein)